MAASPVDGITNNIYLYIHTHTHTSLYIHVLQVFITQYSSWLGFVTSVSFFGDLPLHIALWVIFDIYYLTNYSHIIMCLFPTKKMIDNWAWFFYFKSSVSWCCIHCICTWFCCCQKCNSL